MFIKINDFIYINIAVIVKLLMFVISVIYHDYEFKYKAKKLVEYFGYCLNNNY